MPQAPPPSSGTRSLIEVKALSKWFGLHQVLKAVSLSVERSEVLCVIGPSGSGKSTLLRCINRLEDYEDGEVLLEGVPIAGTRPRRGRPEPGSQPAKHAIAMVFQQFNLWPHMTALENVTQPLVLV